MSKSSQEQKDLYRSETAWKHEIKIKMIKVWNIKIQSYQEERKGERESGEN